MLSRITDARHLPAVGAPIAPQFETPGPYRPGMDVPVVFALTNLDAETTRNVCVRFLGEGLTFNPATITIDSLAAGNRIDVRTSATILPVNGKRQVKLYAEVRASKKPLFRSTEVIAPVVTRSEIHLEAFDEIDGVSLTVHNKGDIATNVRLVLVGDGIPSADPPETTFAPDGRRAVSDPIPLDVASSVSLTLRGATIDRIIAVADDGERTTTEPQRRRAGGPRLAEPDFALETPENGIRRGDVVRFALTIENVGDEPATAATLLLTLPDGMRPLDDTITINYARPAPGELDFADHQLRLALGLLNPSLLATVRGALFVENTLPNDDESVDLLATITAQPDLTVSAAAELTVDQRPAFAPASTFLGPLDDNDDGFVIVASVTNGDPVPIPRTRIRWNLLNLLPRADALREDGSVVTFQPIAFEATPTLITDIGTLGAYATATVTLRLRPVLSNAERRHLEVAATVLTATSELSLGVQERDVNGHPDLHRSFLELTERRPLQIGMPIDVKLHLCNDGDAPAHDVRIKLDLPDTIETSLVSPEGASGWTSVFPTLPPGGMAAMPFTFRLIGPPPGETTTIRVRLDADAHAPIDLEPIVFDTPTKPLVDPPTIIVSTLDDGNLAVSVTVTNLGAGIARNVVLTVPDDGTIIRRSTAIDNVPIADRGTTSPLIGGLALGDLPSRAYREISWHASPRDSLSYRARATVSSDNAPTVDAISAPRRPRTQAPIAFALPAPRRIEDTSAWRALGPAVDSGPSFVPPPAASHRPTPHAIPAPPAPYSDVPLNIEMDPSVDECATPYPEDPFVLPPDPAPAPTAPPANPPPYDDFEASPDALPEFPPLDFDPYAPARTIDAPDESSAPFASPVDKPLTAYHDPASVIPLHSVYDVPVAPEPPSQAEPPVEASFSAVVTNVRTRRALRLAHSIRTLKGLSWWRHIIILRSLLADDVPGDESALSAYADLRDALDAAVMNCAPPLFDPAFTVSEPWVDTLHENDPLAIANVKAYGALTGVGALAAVRTTGELDRALTALLPTTFGQSAVDAAFLPYRARLVTTLSDSTIVALDGDSRRTKFSRMTNPSLDEALNVFLASVPL